MSFSSFYNLLIQSTILTIIALNALVISGAQVRTSSSYQLQSDSINFAGGLSSSSDYSLESTAGEIATGPSDSSTYKLRAGYQQLQEVFISITDASNVSLLPNIGGLTGGISNGSTSVSVLTDSPSGYQLTISAESSPSMQNGAESIADYSPWASPEADYFFLVPTSSASFGFSPEGDDIASHFINDGAACGVGALKTSLVCWEGLTTSETVISQGAANQPTGATTTINFRVGVDNGVGVLSGTYIATTTLTAVAL